MENNKKILDAIDVICLNCVESKRCKNEEI